MSIATFNGLMNPISIIDGTDVTKRVQFATSNITTGNTRTVSIPDADVTILDASLAATLTNKTIAAGSNTITGINNASIAASAGIDATKIGNGDVTSSQLSYLNTCSSNVQTQLAGKAATSHTHVAANVTDFTTAVSAVITTQAGANNGLATLNSQGKVPASQLQLNSVTYQGSWNASTNTPTLTSGVGTQGWYYIVSVAGNTTLDGDTGWQVGDWVIFSTAWDRVPISSAVTSVAGKTGIVTLATGDITSGTFADARIAVTNVTQWVGSLNIQSLGNAPAGTVVGTSDAMTLSNKSLINANCFHVDGTDPTKKIGFVSALASTGTTLSLSSQQTTSQTILYPNVAATDTFVTLALTQTLTNKTLTNPIISSITNGAANLSLPTSSDTILGRNTTDTLTNKTLLTTTTTIADTTDSTKRIVFSNTSATTSTTLTIAGQQSTSQTLSIPNVAANDVLMTTATVQTITGAKAFNNVSYLAANSSTYSTGTVSQSTATVTGVGTTFTSTMVGGVIVYANGAQAFITAFVSSTSLTVKQSATVSSQAYVLYYGNTQMDNAGNFGGKNMVLSGLTASLPIQTDANKNLVSAAINLSGAQVTSTLPVANGGTGGVSYTAGYFIQGNGTSALTALKTVPAGVVVGTTDIQTFTNKTLNNASCFFSDNADATKTIGFSSSGATTATTLTLTSVQTTSQSILVPNISSTDTIMTLSTQQTVTGAKTFNSVNGLMTSPSIYNIGTVSQSTTTVTGSGTTFTSSMVGGVIVYANGAQAYITAFGSTTTLTVSQSATVTAQTYVLYYGGYQHDNLGNVSLQKLNVNSLSASLPVQTDASKNLITAAINLSTQITNTLSVANGGTGAITLAANYLLQGNGTSAIQAVKICPTGVIIGDTDAQTLSNKTINAASNTITNIVDANINSSAAINVTKLGNGDVNSTQLSYLNTVSSNVQTQINNCAPASTSAWSTNNITTSNASTTSLTTIATTTNTSYLLGLRVVARRTDSGSESAGYTFDCLFRNNAGVLTLVAQDKIGLQDNAAWGCSVSVSGTNIIVSVVGAVSSTINWTSLYKTLSV